MRDRRGRKGTRGDAAEIRRARDTTPSFPRKNVIPESGPPDSQQGTGIQFFLETTESLERPPAATKDPRAETRRRRDQRIITISFILRPCVSARGMIHVVSMA